MSAKTPARVLVCGGRDYGATRSEQCAFDAQMILLDHDHGIKTIIHGAARGADTMAGEFARASGKEELAFPADWKTHGRRAGPIRNQQMLDEGKPDCVIAFPGGVGTLDMVTRARRAGIRVIRIGDVEAGCK